ncbi:ABC transporter permease [Paenibacillus sp. ACRRX]|uniref:ABC transporter permease n=1 Tax=Paenibacillus sp. ACRRX TaxID=2918206 RepID=UPI001EF6A6A8|nr:ABC transporter permease [Paenibacillus sp. ACRRX]MCG7408468.1 ABC transporter permease [Paenibacillus sp. ACRRX]
MKHVLTFIWRDMRKNRVQIGLVLLLIAVTSFIFFFIRYASDGISAEYKRFAETQHQEHFSFHPNLSVGLNDDQQRQILNQAAIPEQELEQYGFDNLLQIHNLRLDNEAAVLVSELSKQYSFEFEKIRFKQAEENGFRYRWLTDADSRAINQVQVIEGRLPARNGEIAIIATTLGQRKLATGESLSIGGHTYHIVGKVSSPDHIRQYAVDQDYFLPIFVSSSQYESMTGDEGSYYAGRFRDGEQHEDRVHQMANDALFASFLPIAEHAEAVELIQAVISNSGMSNIFLLTLTLLCTGVFLMFLNRRLRLQQQSWGCLIAMGYSRAKLMGMYMLNNLLFSFLGVLVGLSLAYFAADLLIQQFQSQYVLPSYPKLIGVDSLLIGSGSIVIVFNGAAFWMLHRFMQQDVAALLFARQKNEHVNVLTKWVSRATVRLPFIQRVKLQMSARSLKMILLIGITVCLSSILFIMGLSLNQSSTNAVEHRMQGIHYRYDVQYDKPGLSSSHEQRNPYYLLRDKRLFWTDSSGVLKDTKMNVLAFDGNETWLALTDVAGKELNAKLSDGIIMTTAKAELLGIRVGDTLQLHLGNKKINIQITGLSGNGNPAIIYMNKSKLADELGISRDIYNGVFTNTVESGQRQSEGFHIVTVENLREQMKAQASSSQLSAVINQILGGVIAVIMIWLITLITVEENKRNMALLHMLGYKQREIGKMLLNIYVWVLIVAYIVLTPLAIVVVRAILDSVSQSTHDYIPLVYNGFTFVVVLAAILLIYYVVLSVARRIHARTASSGSIART